MSVEPEPGPGGAFALVERYVANPLLRVLLRTPLGALVGDPLSLLSYVGRRSGRRIRTPVVATADGDERVVTTYRDRVTWWRNFRDRRAAVLWIGGDPVPVTGRAHKDPDTVADWLATVQSRGNDGLLQFFGLSADADREQLARVAAELVIVRFAPRPDRPP